MHTDYNRFLDAQGNTIHQINYKIPNSQLEFIAAHEGFMATVNVNISVVGQNNERRALQEFKQNIGAQNRDLVDSGLHYFLDKISLTLKQEQSGLKLEIEFQDVNSGNAYLWSEPLINLPNDSLISDLEFSHRVNKNSIHLGLEKFRRGDYEFYVDPAHIYQKGINDTLFIYYEIQNLFPAVDNSAYLTELIRVFNDDYSSEASTNLKVEDTTLDRIQRIPADTLNVGYYQIEILINDLVSHRSASVKDYFVINEKSSIGQSLFKDIEKEHQLLRYFLPTSRFKSWNTMSETAKWNFVDRFWSLNDPNPHTKENEFIESVRERIEYANLNFSYFKEGWETDLGRIYIRNGEPNDREQNVTDTDTKLTRKEFEIWKYRNSNRVYLFIDIQGNGNYRLIYSKNDDMEQTANNWEKYLGEDFDVGKLE